MHVVVVAGVLFASLVALAWSQRRRLERRRLPQFQIVPAVPHCRVRAAADIAAAWRAAGFAVDLRGRAVEVRSNGELAVVELPASRRLGDAPFIVRAERAELVHELATIAARELGPLVCSIDGYVHGFDVPDAPAEAGRGSATVSLRPSK